jgi:hypothetical protein
MIAVSKRAARDLAQAIRKLFEATEGTIEASTTQDSGSAFSEREFCLGL